MIDADEGRGVMGLFDGVSLVIALLVSYLIL